jgi:mRNA interferase YafQ
MKYKIIETSKFKQDLKRCVKRGYNKKLLAEVIEIISCGIPLPAKYNAHKLKGKYKGCWECHISPDWLLIWQQRDKELILILTDTGTHSDLY